jgi:copper homeostasis protein
MGAILEICVESVASCVAAEEGGADRVELCANLAVGGVTPSAGVIALACRLLTIPVHVLIRPRGGDFSYSDLEFEVMCRDVEIVKSLGARGAVIGLLDPHGAIDSERTAQLIALARPLVVTFHKAFDVCRDQEQALEILVELGVERILTSGRARTAIEGLDQLGSLVRNADGRIAIMAGGAIGAPDLSAIAATGITEVHVGSSVVRDGETSAEQVRRIVDLRRGTA